MKKNIANFITAVRISGSILMAFLPAFSIPFYTAYLVCGLSDITDGAIARKTNSASLFGAKFDTSADFLFAVVSLAKLLQRIPVPEWIWVWIAVIVLIKAANTVSGFARSGELVSVHSVMNKVTGLLLFLFPLTLNFIELKYSAGVVCSIATVSAVQEGYLIEKGPHTVIQLERRPNDEA